MMQKRFFCLFFFLGIIYQKPYCQEIQTPFFKTVHLSNEFTINIFSDNPSEIYKISKIDPLFIKIISKSEANETVSFTFIANKTGLTDLHISKISDNTETKYVQYKIEIINIEKKKEEENLLQSRKKERKKKSSDGKDYLFIIQSYLRDNFYKLADQTYDEVIIKKGYKNENLFNIIKIINPHWLMDKENQKATKEIKMFIKKTNPQKKDLIFLNYQLALHQKKLKNYDEALSYLYQIKSTQKNSDEYPKSLFLIGEVAFLKKQYSSALKNYYAFYEYHKNNKEKHVLKNYDICLYKIGGIYEIDTKLLDIKKSHYYYSLLIEECPFSYYFQKAKERVNHLEKNFIKVE